MTTTTSMEDYLERIYELIQEKGYARVVDIAESLGVQQPSVTKMIQKLDEQRFVCYERYRGLVLTPAGEKLARSVRRRHETIAKFLQLLGVPAQTIDKDAEGIEHHLSKETVDRISQLAQKLAAHPEWIAEIAGGTGEG
jgi:Mn-dependent DtxR family transcriptional regulator